ncbi:hypothetical protein Cgig2_017258 [Carnegiea gigantea]|uniref:Uncharacterized protein n=1 Tax=Carnegiea gigantea TaxID=171969 RepID=A0A9Q1GTT9_9CARY|nr:hypothetical protein Cgig2_017258 [Carnegiea gigantea]
MALNKPRKTSLPQANHPKVPTGSSMKCSASDESSMRRNLKRPAVESSQLGDDIKEQDAIFRPWRSFTRITSKRQSTSSAAQVTDMETACIALPELSLHFKKPKNLAILVFTLASILLYSVLSFYGCCLGPRTRWHEVQLLIVTRNTQSEYF